MKRTITIALTASFLSTFTIKAQTTNYNFENWTGNDPNGWSTFNGVPGAPQTTFQQTINPGQGTKSAKMVTAACPSCPNLGFSNPLGGAVMLGSTGEGIPFTQKPISVDFKYKSNPLSGDMGGFLVQLTKWDVVNQQTDVIGEAWYISTISKSSWTSINLPISYLSNSVPDTLNIVAFSSLGNSNFPVPTIPNPVVGSEFYIDAISLNLPSCASLLVSAAGSNETSPLAANGTASAIVSGGAAPYTFLWNTGATSSSISNLLPGLYNVTVTDNNGCSKVASYNVLAGSCNGLAVTVTGTNATSFTSNNGSAVANVTGGTPPYSYVWNNGATTASISGLDVGAYVVTVTDNTSNCVQFGFFTIYAGNSSIGLNEWSLNYDSAINIAPNPSSGIFNVTASRSFSKVRVTNYLGQIISELPASSNKVTLNLSNQKSGIYFVSLLDKGNVISTKKVVLQN